jgi:hypothetical protein
MFLDLGTTPLADRFVENRGDEEERFPLRVAMCERCKLVQLQDIVPDEVLYGSDYAYYTGASKTHDVYWTGYARDIEERFEPQSVLEIACNDGSLLTKFSDVPYRLGIDPASGPLEHMDSKIARINDAFTAALAGNVGQTFDVVIANNVLAHVSNMEDFVRGLDKVTHRDSVVVIEVQYLADLLVGNQFDHFYHEHRSFFSLRTLTRLFIALGFTIFDVERQAAQGGSLRVFLSKGSFKYPVSAEVEIMKAGEAWLDEWFTMESLVGRVDHIRDSLVEGLYGWRKFYSQGVLAGYGATAKSCTLLNYCGIDHEFLDWVQDTTPWKQNKFTPGTQIPVLAPKDEPVRPDLYLLLAWNYLPAILRKETIYMIEGGKFLVPLPKPVVL